ADQLPHQLRPDQADETDGAGNGHPAADAERDARYHGEPQPADIDAQALRGLLAEAQRTKSAALAEQNDRPRGDERQRQHDMAETAILQRTEQPKRNFKRRKGIAG